MADVGIKREEWKVRNKSNSIILIGDLPKVPGIKPNGVIDLLNYHTKETIGQSDRLVSLMSSNILIMIKKAGATNSIISTEDSTNSITSAEINETGEFNQWVPISGGNAGISYDGGDITVANGNIHFEIGNSGVLANGMGIIHINTTQSSNVGPDAEDIMTYDLPANSFNKNGQVLRITVWGTTAANSHIKTINLDFGGTTMATYSQAGDNLDFKMLAIVSRVGASAQDYIAETQIGSSIAGAWEMSFGTATETDTSSIQIAVNTDNPSAVDVIVHGMMVEILN